MTIDLNMAAGFYKAEKHQFEAFKYLQSILTEAELAEFARLYRTKAEVKPLGFVERILTRLKQLNIILIDGFTVIGVEGVNKDLSPNGDDPDLWNDIVFGITKNKNTINIVGPFTCTTEPGRWYTKNRLSPKGAAFVKLDFKQEGVWQLGTHKDQPNCLVQTGAPITVIRDAAGDGSRAGDKEERGWFGINMHHTKGNYDKNSIGRWSAGCCVLPSPQQHQEIVKAFKASKQNKCSYILLDGSKL